MANAIGRIYQARGKRWRIRLPGRIDIYCDKSHRSFYSEEHARWTLAQIQGEIENGTFDADFYAKTKKSLHSFEVYATEWLANAERSVEKGELSPTYVKELRRYVKKMFIPALGKMNISEIRTKHLKAFYRELDKSPKTIFNIMGALHKVFADALDDGVIQAIPVFPVKFKLSELPEPEVRWATEEIQDEIFQQLDPNEYFFIFFQATHGTRTGETRALQHGDIDLVNDTVTIKRAFSGTLLRHTKVKKYRILPLDPQWKRIYLANLRNINPDEYVFLKNGRPFSESWARKKWNEARDKAEVAHITLYAGTRHSIASQAVNRGVDIYLISKFLGHSSIHQTERYARLMTEPLRPVQRKATVHQLRCAKGVQDGDDVP